MLTFFSAVSVVLMASKAYHTEAFYGKRCKEEIDGNVCAY